MLLQHFSTIFFLCALVVGTFSSSRLDVAAAELIESGESRPETEQAKTRRLVRALLDEKLSQRDFLFADVIAACADQQVLPLEPRDQPVVDALNQAMDEIARTVNKGLPAVRATRRINEVSRVIEDLLKAKLDKHPELHCEIPKTVKGTRQRSGYPDLLLTHRTTGRHYYLDPKLLAADSKNSSFRTFYFEPKEDTLKITHDAVHLLIGITHNGQQGGWQIEGWRIVDLATLRVRLKAEFHASNRDLYRHSVLSLPSKNP